MSKQLGNSGERLNKGLYCSTHVKPDFHATHEVPAITGKGARRRLLSGTSTGLAAQLFFLSFPDPETPTDRFPMSSCQCWHVANLGNDALVLAMFFVALI